MPDEEEWTHITHAVLIDYFDKDVTDEEEDRIELHLARCEECAQRARQASALCDLWGRWTARTHSEAFLRAVVRNALESATSGELSNDTWKRRIHRWRSTSSGLVEGVVKVTVEAVKNASLIVTGGMDNLLRPRARWRFALQPESVAIRGVARRRKSPPKIALAEAPDGSLARVKIEDHDDKREVVISVDQFPRTWAAPIVMLISISRRGEEKPRLLQMRRQGQGLIARFGGLRTGEYLVAFEPLPAGHSY